jgi:hypothetical protein
VGETILIALSGRAVAVPIGRLHELADRMRSAESPYSARSKIDRTLAANATAIRFDAYEKAETLAVLSQWIETGSVDELGTELMDVHDELQRDTGDSETPPPS